MYDESTDEYKFDALKVLTRTKQVMFKQIPEANYSRFGLFSINRDSVSVSYHIKIIDATLIKSLFDEMIEINQQIESYGSGTVALRKDISFK